MTGPVTLPTATSILVTREFAAAPHLVYRCCTEPDLVRRWWGGGVGEVAVADVDLRVGGRWRVVVVGDGYEVGFHGVYREIVPAARIVCTEVYEGAPDAPSDALGSTALCTYTFTGTGGCTTLTLLIAMRSGMDRDALLDSGMEEGLQESWDLLERVAVSLR
jgi:uncharacterized protein YndB with AHSA1/START domain